MKKYKKLLPLLLAVLLTEQTKTTEQSLSNLVSRQNLFVTASALIMFFANQKNSCPKNNKKEEQISEYEKNTIKSESDSDLDDEFLYEVNITNFNENQEEKNSNNSFQSYLKEQNNF